MGGFGLTTIPCWLRKKPIKGYVDRSVVSDSLVGAQQFVLINVESSCVSCRMKEIPQCDCGMALGGEAAVIKHSGYRGEEGLLSCGTCSSSLVRLENRDSHWKRKRGIFHRNITTPGGNKNLRDNNVRQ